MSDDAEGTPFGRYRLIELLGRGGMGEVWRAYDTAIERTVALKRLPPHFAQDKTFEQRFRREARAAARLDDAHVVPIHDVGEIDGQLYVTMRLIKGRDLQAMLDGGAMDPQRAVGVVAQIAGALDAAHQIGLVHRDVKPSNILLTDTDFAYLIDFGIARAVGDTGITSTGATIGTWAYMAPERFRTGEIEPASDIYSLACVLYQCLTGETPFPRGSFEQIAVAHLADPPPRLSERRGGIPPGMDHVIATGLAKDPAHRYRNASDLAAAAQRALTAAPSIAADPGTTVPGHGAAQPTMAAGQRHSSPMVPPPWPPWPPPAHPPKKPAIRAATLVPLVVVALLFACAAGFAATQVLRPVPRASTAPPEWQPYVDYAKQFTVDLASLDYRDPDSAIQRILDGSTGSFHDDFASKRSDFRQTIVSAKASSQGNVDAAALESISGTTAQVLVAETSKTTNAAGATQDPRHLRLLVQVEKLGGGYKVSKVEFVP